jgi:hypothetical protein
VEFIDQAAVTPQLGGINPIEARRREVDAVFFWQSRLCASFRSLPQIELLYRNIISALEKQFKGAKPK